MVAENRPEFADTIIGRSAGKLLGAQQKDVASAVDAAYADLKNLENSGQLTFPELQDTVVVGTIDPGAGTFTWTVPTLVQTITTPPPPNGRTNTVIQLTVGVVSTTAVDLLLRFNVVPVQTRPVSALAATAEPADVKVAVSPIITKGVTSGVFGESNGDVTISGGPPGTNFPTATSATDHIILDAGMAVSTVSADGGAAGSAGASGENPAVSRFDLTISIPGKPNIPASIFILRPPVLGIGAFTIEAMPVALVYAPPQGTRNLNFATYTQSKTVTRTVTTAISNGTSTKTTPAYTAADLISKAAGAITAVAAVVGTGGAAAAGPSVAGALSELGAALTGGAASASDSTASATQSLSSGLNLVGDILSALDDSPVVTDTDTLTVETDHSMTLAHTDSTQYKTDPGKGPGVGDRIIFLYNLRVIWMVVNGDVGIHVLGAEGTIAFSAESLVAEQQNLEAGGQPTLSPALSLDAVKTLLASDVMVQEPQSEPINTSLLGRLEPPRVGLPRFVPADPPEMSGTDSGGDTYTVTVDQSTDDKQVTTSTQITASDLKPGWADVLFGADDNTDTSTTATMTTTQTADLKSDLSTTSTVVLFDSYDVLFLTDSLYSSYAVLDVNSPLLQGVDITARA